MSGMLWFSEGTRRRWSGLGGGEEQRLERILLVSRTFYYNLKPLPAPPSIVNSLGKKHENLGLYLLVCVVSTLVNERCVSTPDNGV